MNEQEALVGNSWKGFFPPQRLLYGRRFVGIVLDPPDLKPGSWRGAGDVVYDRGSKRFYLTTRPRKVGVRGFAVEIYSSPDGERFKLENSISKQDLSKMTGFEVRSIEGQQHLLDPSTMRYHLYLSVDDGHGWQTILLTADNPAAKWTYECFVLQRGESYDNREARDSSIDIIDGRYIALYKANESGRVRTALATSEDGFSWKKLGVPTIDGEEQPDYLLLCGSIFAGTSGPIFVGFESREIRNGAALSRWFSAYQIDLRNLNLERIVTGTWSATTPYEKEPFPVHSYVDIVRDPLQPRFLMYVETIDPQFSQDFGVNLEVDRVLLFECPI